jgi:hypothetical protein
MTFFYIPRKLIRIFAFMFKRVIFILFIFVSTFAIAPQAKAQCSMCTINAEQGTKNGNTQGNGLNNGIIYLMAFPFLLIAGVGILWYKNYRIKITEDTIN